MSIEGRCSKCGCQWFPGGSPGGGWRPNLCANSKSSPENSSISLPRGAKLCKRLEVNVNFTEKRNTKSSCRFSVKLGSLFTLREFWWMARIYICVCNDVLVLLTHRKLWRGCAVLLPVPAILGGAQSSDLFANSRTHPGAQHYLQVCWEQPRQQHW